MAVGPSIKEDARLCNCKIDGGCMGKCRLPRDQWFARRAPGGLGSISRRRSADISMHALSHRAGSLQSRDGAVRAFSCVFCPVAGSFPPGFVRSSASKTFGNGFSKDLFRSQSVVLRAEESQIRDRGGAASRERHDVVYLERMCRAAAHAGFAYIRASAFVSHEHFVTNGSRNMACVRSRCRLMLRCKCVRLRGG
jgi:hypothetical protein